MSSAGDNLFREGNMNGSRRKLRSHLSLAGAAIAVSVLAPAVVGQQSMPAWQIAAGGRTAFEVASIKPAAGEFRRPLFPLDAGSSYAVTGGRFSARFPLLTYITFAYKLTLSPDQRQAILSQLPKWAGTESFDIEARAPQSNATKDQMRLMMQSLLAERFKLATHFETQTVAAYGLMPAKAGKTGPQLLPHDQSPVCDPNASLNTRAGGPNAPFTPVCDIYALDMQPGGMVHAAARNTTMAALAAAIPTFGAVRRPVVDRTGLSDRFDITINWARDANNARAADANTTADPDGPTFLQALNEQLGLRLEAIQAPIETLVIDHVERPSEN
jgi:bla regulator protein blaR1